MMGKMGKAVGSLGLFSLVMLITGPVDSIRNLPATALFGSSLIFFMVFASVFFLIPTALVSAELASVWPEKSGIYHWIKAAFGDRIAFLAIWLQWASNLVWFPTMLSFIAGTATYFLSPTLAQNKFYLISVILTVFWCLTLINLKGIKISARFTSICTVSGLAIPLTSIVLLAFIWLVTGHPSSVHFTMENLFPKFNDAKNWISLTAIMTAFLGMELAAVHIKDVHHPQKTFPKALLVSVLLILATMTLGALSIAIVLPKDHINLVNGVMQAFTDFFNAYHVGWLIPVMTLLILLGVSGGIISWVISPAKGLLQAANEGFLPPFLRKENAHGVAHHLLIVQGVIVSVICLAFLLMPSVNGSYWLLTALSTQLYILMYVIMFLASIVIRFKYQVKPSEHGFMIPGGKLGIFIVCLGGIFGCVITLIVGFIPPEGINVGSLFHYETIFMLGMTVMILPTYLCVAYKNKRDKNRLDQSDQSDQTDQLEPEQVI